MLNRFLKSPFFKIILVLLLGIIFTAIATWPFVINIPYFYSDFGDYPLAGASFWYNQNAIVTGKILNQLEYLKGFEFYPQPYVAAYADFKLIASLIFSLFFWISNSLVFSINMVTFFTFVLSFIAAFYFVKYFTKNNHAGIIGGLVYAFNPLAFGRFPLHLELLHRFFLPLLFLFAYKFFKNPNFKNSFFFYLVFTLNSFSAVYFLTFSLVLLPFFFLPFFLKKFKDLDLVFAYLLSLAKYSIVFVIFIPILLYFNLPYLEFSKNENVTRSIEGNIYFSARLVDYFAPHKDSLIYGGLVKSLEEVRSPRNPENNEFNYEEHTLFLNIIPFLLFLIFLLTIKKRFYKNKLLFSSFFLILVLSFIFTFGPYFQGWKNYRDLSIPLPYLFLYDFFPFFKGIRAPTRFEFFFYVPFTLFVSFGFLEVSKRLTKKKELLFFLIIICILLLENLSTGQYGQRSDIVNYFKDGKKFEYLNNKATLHLPVNIPNYGKESAYSNWLTFTNERIVNGNTGYLPPDQIAFLESYKKELTKEQIAALGALKVDYLIYHKNYLTKSELDKIPMDLIGKGIVYKDEKVLIVDIKKIIDFKIKICDFKKDIEIKSVVASLANGGSTRAIYLKNTKDCYFPSIDKERYKIVDGFHIRMPLLVKPNQEVILSEVMGEIRPQD